MPLPKFFLESADHVLNEFLAQHLVLQARQKAIFQLLTLDPQTVSANAIAALRMEESIRTPIVTCSLFHPPA